MNTKEKEKILAAITFSKYEIEIEEPNAVNEYTKYDGTPFLRVSQESEVHSEPYYCKVHICGHHLLCNLKNGLWYEDDQPLDDAALVTALNNAEDIISGIYNDAISLCELYIKLNHLPNDTDFCMEDDADCLKDINELGGAETEIPVRYTFEEEGNDYWNEVTCCINDGDLYELYKLLEKRELLPVGDNEYEMSDRALKLALPDLYHEIIEQLLEMEESETRQHLKFVLPLSFETFEYGLYGNPMN